MLSVSLPLFKSESVNLEALIPLLARAFVSLFKSDLENDCSNLSSISSYKRESSTVQPSALGCIPNSLITSKTAFSDAMSLSFKANPFTSP
jgi:hypothetical protein